ncbi:MAG TPA: Hpt domain-containing protein [Candidatus Binataceae bacterium]|nr:Hpt domain-containing protein [Candidatus Binataceae bacterium]
MVVEVDPEIKDLIPGYLARKRADVERIQSALAAGNFAAVATVAHKLKGEGGGFGLDELSEMSAALERAAKAGDGDDARRLAGRISDYINTVEVV